MANWRNTKAYRIWRARVVRRDVRCQICGSLQNRVAHHIFDASHHPDKRFDVTNGIVLCADHHVTLHTDYKKNYRYKTTMDDLFNYIEVLKLGERLGTSEWIGK